VKHLLEYEDSEIKGLMGDLRSIGLNDLESILIQTISKGEGSFDCWILVAKDDEQMVDMLLDVELVSPVEFGYRVSYANGSIKKPRSVVDLLRGLSYGDKDIASFKIFTGLDLKPSVKSPMLVCFQGNDFYKSINLLETYYTNVREVMNAKLKSEWGNNLHVQKWTGN
jgi:hypothetical protein